MKKVITQASEVYEISSPFLLQKDVTQFNGKKLSQMEPHVFAISEAAFQNLHSSQKNQSCIISGESGAGKVTQSYVPLVCLVNIPT